MTYLVLRLLHILFTATWFGSTLFAGGDIRRTLAAGPEHVALLRERMRRVTRVVAASAVLSILTGFALIFAVGGFGAVPVGIHMGMLTAVLAWVVGFLGQGMTWAKIDAALDRGAPPAEVEPLARRYAMANRAVHGLWLLTLILMVFRGQIG